MSSCTLKHKELTLPDSREIRCLYNEICLGRSGIAKGCYRDLVFPRWTQMLNGLTTCR